MSKFTIRVELQGLKIEVEGTKEDAPKLANQIGKQLGGLLQAPATLANGSSVIEGEVLDGNGTGKKARKQRKAGGTKTPADDLNFTHDPENYGAPQQEWTQAQKAIWFLYVVGEQAHITQQTAYSIAKNFNRYFKASGQINAGNVLKGLEKERLKTPATVNADLTDGTAKYFLTTAGTTLASRLAKGETVNTD